MNLKLTPIRFGIAVLFLVATAYHGRGYYLLTVHETTPHDLNMRWREQQSIICGATVDLKGQRITREQQKALVPKYGFRVESNPSRGGYPPWSFLPGYVFYWPQWPMVKLWFGFVNVLATLGIVVCLRLVARLSLKNETEIALWLPISSVLAVNSFTSTLYMGQFGIICVAALAGALLSVQSPRKVAGLLSGVLLGIAMSKPNLSIPFLVPFLVRGRWLTLCTCALYMLTASLVVWWASHVDPISMLGKVNNALNYSAAAGRDPVAMAINSGIDPVWALRTIAIAVVGVYCWIVLRSPKRTWLELFAGASVASRLWTYHRHYDNVILVFLLTALVIKAIRSPDSITVGCFLIVGLSLWVPARVHLLPHFDTIQMIIWPTALFVVFRYAPLDESTGRNDTSLSLNNPRLECRGGA